MTVLNYKKFLGYGIGGLLLVILAGFAIFQHGTLFQGNLNLHEAANSSGKSQVALLIPSNQLRAGTNAVLKMNVITQKYMAIENVRVNFNFNDVGVSEMHLFKNNEDVTGLLTAESQKLLATKIDARKKAFKNKTMLLEFGQPVAVSAGQSAVFEVRLNADNLTKDSALVSNVIDMRTVADGVESIVTGPYEKTRLEVTYTMKVK